MPVPTIHPQLFPVPVRADRSGATVFTRNMTLPVHRWFRYSAGFSAEWVQAEIESRRLDRPVRVLDPFAGSGTTLIAGQVAGAEAWGVESHPFVARVARAKLNWTADPGELHARASEVLRRTSSAELPDPLPSLLGRIFEPRVLAELYGIGAAIDEVRAEDAVDDLLWLGLVAILRPCSPVGTAQWQYVLPNKSKARVAEPRAAFEHQVQSMVEDMRAMQTLADPVPATLRPGDARRGLGVPDHWADLVITSPPYPNNYDYADATRIEMTFLGEVRAWGDLQTTVRRHLIRSCSQHMAGYSAEDDLHSTRLSPIAAELGDVYRQLDAVRLQRGGRKSYHSMVVAYFADLADCWVALRRATADGGSVIFVIGDSAPYGIYVPAERWLGELAVAAGFKSFTFEKLRDRNTKWKNRKHRVPLHEGLLVVEG